jgi:RNA polymerase sigma-70 factor, ECF subfamily
MTLPFETELTESLPRLRSMARKMTKNYANADDLLQDTVTRMLYAKSRYTPGSNLLAWGYRIMYNSHISLLRRHRPDMVELDHVAAMSVSHRPRQEDRIALNELTSAFRRLPADQRVPLTLIVGGGQSYHEVASMLGTSAGTIKSRVSRGRQRLRDYLCPIESGRDSRQARAVIASREELATE